MILTYEKTNGEKTTEFVEEKNEVSFISSNFFVLVTTKDKQYFRHIRITGDTYVKYFDDVLNKHKKHLFNDLLILTSTDYDWLLMHFGAIAKSRILNDLKKLEHLSKYDFAWSGFLEKGRLTRTIIIEVI